MGRALKRRCWKLLQQGRAAGSTSPPSKSSSASSTARSHTSPKQHRCTTEMNKSRSRRILGFFRAQAAQSTRQPSDVSRLVAAAAQQLTAAGLCEGFSHSRASGSDLRPATTRTSRGCAAREVFFIGACGTVGEWQELSNKAALGLNCFVKF